MLQLSLIKRRIINSQHYNKLDPELLSFLCDHWTFSHSREHRKSWYIISHTNTTTKAVITYVQRVIISTSWYGVKGHVCRLGGHNLQRQKTRKVNYSEIKKPRTCDFSPRFGACRSLFLMISLFFYEKHIIENIYQYN